jgi:hypothetical protein
MPVKDVEFGKRHILDQPLDGADLEVVPGGVDHDASMLKSRLILDFYELKFITK